MATKPNSAQTRLQEGQYEVTVPVILDRCHQARVKNALEPEWEARFEPRSYGFRPGRCCQDAAESLYATLKGKSKRTWILDADLTAAFDKIDHSFLLSQLGTFPARDMIAGWLKAGVFEADKGFAPTEEGTPQGGIISPLLLNVALHGLEEAAGVRYQDDEATQVAQDSPALVRYADDFAACCHSRQQAGQVKARLAGWLAQRGLSLNEDKTRIVCLTRGFDFLGWNIRRYPNGKLLIKPSKAAIGRHRQRLAEEMRTMRGSNALAVIVTLNPVIRGWTAYHRSQVSSEAFTSLASLHVGAHLEVGTALAPEQGPALGRGPVLRQVPPEPGRPVGLRRQGHRDPPGQALLDGNPPSRHGQGHGIP